MDDPFIREHIEGERRPLFRGKHKYDSCVMHVNVSLNWEIPPAHISTDRTYFLYTRTGVFSIQLIILLDQKKLCLNLLFYINRSFVQGHM